ncbi:ester cyclase [Pandoraea communis]|uniref:ester cyclase n=1 Tax=Pandoraea communis TaxID=2508297 RepID=UPI0025A52080|nr:ester cyclase [Pandoraea communis]MDM8355805.1 ester cyclase [Pandoraea communis]
MHAKTHRWLHTVALTPALILGTVTTPAFAQFDDLVKPGTLVVDRSLPKKTLEAEILAARRYGTFWNTGDETMARNALAPTFFDNTLPDGRPQGIEGVLAASKGFRAAVPDLRCEVRQMIVAGDRVVTHLHFTGHFTGTFMGKQGSGQNIDFIATDIYRIADGRIAEDWHLEDNLTFLQQAGLAAK